MNTNYNNIKNSVIIVIINYYLIIHLYYKEIIFLQLYKKFRIFKKKIFLSRTKILIIQIIKQLSNLF